MGLSEYFTGALRQRMSDDLHLAGVSRRTHALQQHAPDYLQSFGQRIPLAHRRVLTQRFIIRMCTSLSPAAESARTELAGLQHR